MDEIAYNDIYEIETPTGWKSFDGIIKKNNKESIKLNFNDGTFIISSPNHLFKNIDNKLIKAKDFINHTIINKYGKLIICEKISKLPNQDLFDIFNINDDEHLFYSNNIISHNCGLAENFFKSVFPTVSASKTAKIVITSTPNGDGNIFYRLYQGALNHENGWACDSVIWSDVPGRDEKWKQETMKTMGSAEAFAQEFEAVFISSKSTFVNEELIQTLKHKIKDPLYVFEDGKYKIWEEPNENNIYVAGIDTSEGIGRDSSEINILDITNLQDIRQVATYSNNNIQPYDYATKTFEILQQWGNPLALIERNNQGGIVIDNLINRYGYENIVSWGASLANRKNVQQGIISHTNVRNKAVGIMRYLLTEAQVVTINNLDTIEEFRNFVRYPNGVWAAKKGENYHDDKVLSLIWSLFILNDDIISTYFDVKGRDKNGIPNKIEKFPNGINYFDKNEHTLELQQYNTQNYANDVFLIGGVNNNTLTGNWEWLGTYGNR